MHQENKKHTVTHKGNCIPSVLPKVHDQVMCGEINVVLSSEMCFFMIINEDGLDVKELCRHSRLKKCIFYLVYGMQTYITQFKG